MKRVFFLMLLTLFATGQTGLLGKEEGKEYICPEQVVVCDEGIFVLLDDELVKVGAILDDTDGLYCIKPPSVHWTCKKCGYTKNPIRSYKCKNCKEPFYE